MIRILVAALLALALLPAAASAHPLGNFSVNHLTRVSVSVRPRRRALHPRRGRDPDVPAARRGRRRAAAAQAGRGRAAAGADRRRPPRRAAGGGAPGRSRTRRARAGCGRRASSCRWSRAWTAPRRVELRDGTFPGRVGWKAVVVEPGEGTAVRSSVTADDPTNGLRAYPEDLLESPSDVRSATPRGAARRRHRAGARRAAVARDRRRRSRLRRRVQRRRRRTRRARAPAAERVRLGRVPRALARPRQGDGRRLPRRHARDRAARGRARR